MQTKLFFPITVLVGLVSIALYLKFVGVDDAHDLSSAQTNDYSGQVPHGPPLPQTPDSAQILEVKPNSKWEAILNNGGKANFEMVQGGIDDDGFAFQVNIIEPSGANEWDIQTVLENIPLQSDFKHRVGAWVNGPAGTEITLSVEQQDFTLIENKSVVLVGEWQYVVFEFLTDLDEVRTAMHFSYPQNKGKTILIDDIRVDSSL